jgi:hypothetical protein
MAKSDKFLYNGPIVTDKGVTFICACLTVQRAKQIARLLNKEYKEKSNDRMAARQGERG